MQTHSSNHPRTTVAPSLGVPNFDPASAAFLLQLQQNQGFIVPSPLLGPATQAPPLMSMPQQPFLIPRGPLQFPAFQQAALNAQQLQQLGLVMMPGGQVLIPQQPVQVLP